MSYVSVPDFFHLFVVSDGGFLLLLRLQLLRFDFCLGQFALEPLYQTNLLAHMHLRTPVNGKYYFMTSFTHNSSILNMILHEQLPECAR